MVVHGFMWTVAHYYAFRANVIVTLTLRQKNTIEVLQNFRFLKAIYYYFKIHDAHL